MSNSKQNSSASTSRGPFEPPTDIIHLPIVLREIKMLATGATPEKIVPLVDGILKLAQDNGHVWRALITEPGPHVATLPYSHSPEEV